MNLQNIQTVARYEIKYIHRTPIFTGIALIGLLVILFFQYYLQSKEQTFHWFMITLSSSIPFINTYLFTILQSILVILAVNEWKGREKHADTLVTIQAKNISNTEYATGKSLGIIVTLLALNIISLASVMVIHIFDSDFPFQFFPYIFYLFTLSFPSLLFLLGFSMLATALVKNRGISMFILFIFIFISLYHLPTMLHGLLDFRATCLPNVFSAITGHVGLANYLNQRTFFLLTGIACIIFSIGQETRLPGNLRENGRNRTIATGILLLSILPGTHYYQHFRDDDAVRACYRETALKYNNYTPTRITEHEISIRRHAEQFFCHSRLQITNTSGSPLSEILLYLNPALEITGLSNNDGEAITFSRENQVIILPKKLLPYDTLSFKIDYRGNIDERVCYLDINTDSYWNDQFQNSPLHFGKRYAYTGNDYTLLTPECLWYPTTIPSVNLSTPYAVIKNFTRFSLEVTGEQDKTVISQGTPESKGDTIRFNNTHPLTGLTLCIGHLEKNSIKIDSVTMELYTFKGHNHLAKTLKDLTEEKLKTALLGNKKYLENRFKKRYPFSKFRLVETPVSLTTFSRKWENGTELVQPEIVLFPEKWSTAHNIFTRRFQKQLQENMQERANMGMPYTQSREEVYLDFLLRKLFQPNTVLMEYNIFIPYLDNRSATPEMAYNHQDITPMFFNHSNYFYSKDYPIIDKLLYTFETQRKRDNIHFIGSDETFEATTYLSTRSLKDAINDATLPMKTVENILQLKVSELLNYIALKISPDQFQQLINTCKNKSPFRELSFDTLSSRLENDYHIRLNDILPQWYNARDIPSYIVKDIKARKIESDEPNLYQLSFKIYNNSKTDGFISIQAGRKTKGRVYHIPAETSWEIKEIEESEHQLYLSINLHLSGNLPNGITQNLPNIQEVTSDTSRGKFAIGKQAFLPPADEIIVDNEDPGFQIVENSRKKKLGTLFSPKKKKKYIYEYTFNAIHQQPIPEWTYCAGTLNFYGDIIKSMVFKKAGKGYTPVEWTTDLPEDGQYEVSAFIVNRQVSFEGHPEQYYTLTTRDGEENITLKIGLMDYGWMPLGTFHFSAGKNKITLSDKGIAPEQIIFADAVKWKYIGK